MLGLVYGTHKNGKIMMYNFESSDLPMHSMRIMSDHLIPENRIKSNFRTTGTSPSPIAVVQGSGVTGANEKSREDNESDDDLDRENITFTSDSDGFYTISDCSTCPHLLLSTQVGHEIHHRPLIDACSLGIASSLDSSDPAHLGVQHQVKNLHGLLKKTNNAFFRPCRIFLFTGAIQTSIGACKARIHCEEK
ncbi:unnamed protein product [Trichogramma brassicae]|uniref:Uncharacterized protein n=1 Tax=Trichogramma brassicae TaxID=86971 RepID=A0A6H5IDP0_9HYME|nr:unnamed protein product [Trichogramma brassicae]CAB0035068.1 unnamed protein product [Trichogramma brassicae]CAB0035070.1 unnamed protein product [Trichogramma brassicae]CAB0035072.1 unnamed protein product [Trichogramma brassicae]CAB0035074.1 unnamed protein product [Trichogramma brassicae]